MADELNTPTHRWYQPRNNIKLPNTDFSRDTIFDSGIQKINAWINSQPWGSPIPALFAAAEPGVWYDPSDITTLFQDSAGTTPVTVPGQPVGLMLDKSQGLATGSNVASGPWINTFSTAFDTFSSSSGDGFTATTSAAKVGVRVGVPCTFVAGQPYTVSFTLTATNASVASVWFSTSALGGDQAIQNPAQVTSGVRYRAQGVAPAGATHLMLVITASGASSVSLSGLTANALPGNHATQSTAGSRPIYGIQPLGGRRNLAAVSSQPTASTGTSVTANADFGPGGQMTAARVAKTDATTPRYVIINTDMTPQASTGYTISQYVKYDGYDTTVSLEYNGVPNFNVAFIAPFNVTASGVSAVTPTACTSAVTAVGNGWYRISATFTSAAGPFTPSTNPIILSRVTGASGVTILMTDIQVEVAAAPTACQNVVSQYDITEIGVQTIAYLRFDGVDDSLVTPTITPGTDKAQVFAGVQKLSDAATGIVVELSADISANAGSFDMFAPVTVGNTYGFGSRGSAAQLFAVGSGFAAPNTSVLTGTSNISGDSINLRVNGAQAGQNISDQGTGNYGNYPLYIGRRGGASNPFNGYLYSLTVRFGATLAAGTITTVETWVNSRTGAY